MVEGSTPYSYLAVMILGVGGDVVGRFLGDAATLEGVDGYLATRLGIGR